MKSHKLHLLAAAGALFVACQSQAQVTGIEAELYVGPDWVANGYNVNALDTYRVYVTFTNPDDQLIAVFGNMTNVLTLESGCGYVNTTGLFGDHNDTAPVDESPSHYANQWDTFCTIGREFTGGDDETGVTTDFCNEAGGNGVHAFANDLFITNAAWFCPPTILVDDEEVPTPQSVARDATSGASDGDLRVLCMQITVAEGAVLQGSFNAQGGATGTGWGDQTFGWIFDSGVATCAAPDSFNAFRGFFDSGDLASLMDSDDDKLCHNKGITIFPAEAPITLDFDGTLSTETPSALSLSIDSTANTIGLTITVSFRNFDTNQWELIGTAGQTSNNDTLRIFNAAGDDLARFVEDGTGVVRARYEIRKTGISFLNFWGDCIDKLYWTYTP